jgi:hypothetical protein
MRHGRRGPSHPVGINRRGTGVCHELAQRHRRRAAPAVAERQPAAATRSHARPVTILLISRLRESWPAEGQDTAGSGAYFLEAPRMGAASPMAPRMGHGVRSPSGSVVRPFCLLELPGSPPTTRYEILV